MNEGWLSQFLSLVKSVDTSRCKYSTVNCRCYSVSSSVCPVLVAVVQIIVPLFSQGSLYFNGIW